MTNLFKYKNNKQHKETTYDTATQQKVERQKTTKTEETQTTTKNDLHTFKK